MAKINKKIKKILKKEKKKGKNKKRLKKDKGEFNSEKLDLKVKETGKRDFGHLALDICPRCGSSDIDKRSIDIPGYAPEVRVCEKCGFRMDAPVEVPLVKVLEDEEEESEALIAKNRADIEKKLAQVEIEEKQVTSEKKDNKQSKSGKKKEKTLRKAKQN